MREHAPEGGFVCCANASAAQGAAAQVLDAPNRVVAAAPAAAAGATRLPLPAGLAAGVYTVQSGSQAQRLLVE